MCCVTSDAHQGLRRAVEETYPEATWQRCIVHLERDIISHMKTKRQRGMAARVIKAVFHESDPILVRELYHIAIVEISKINKRAGELLEEAEVDALAYLDFPPEHHRRLRTNNIQERENREIKRRSRVVQVFPSVKSLIRLVGAVCSETDEDWSSRKYISPDSLLELKEDFIPLALIETDEATKERALRLIAVAKDIDLKRKTA